jgi:hypothetical protein
LIHTNINKGLSALKNAGSNKLELLMTVKQLRLKLLNSLKGYAKRRLETCSSKVSIWKNEMATALDEVEKYDNQIRELQNEKEDF